MPIRIDAAGDGLIYVDAYSEQLRIEEAYAATADGRIVSVDPDTVQVLLEDDGGVFTDDHTVVVPFPSLAAGAVSTLAYRRVSNGDRRAAPWSQIIFPQTGTPTERFDLLVTWEEGTPAPVVASDSDAARCEEAVRSIRCSARDVMPAPADLDVNYFDVLGHVIVAEPTGWRDLADLLRRYVADSWTDEEAVAAVVAEVTAGTASAREKLEALHSFVAGEIRYVGIETGVNGVVPRDTGLTLSRRYGDCKDKTALFLQMAEIAGLSAVPVVVSSHRKNPEKLITPSLAYFDHMVACVEIDGETATCIDLTDPYSPAVASPGYLSGATALPLVAGTDDVSRMPLVRARWGMAVESHNVLEGSSVHETERRGYGPGHSGQLRAGLAGLNRTELQRWARESYEAVYGTAVPIEFSFAGLDSQQQQVVIESRATFPNAVITGQPLRYEHYPGWMADLVSQFYSTNEHFDYRFEGLDYMEEARFVIDEWQLEALGAAIDFESEFGRMRRDYSIEEGSVVVRTGLELPARVIPVADIERFRRFLDTVLDNSLIRFRARPRR